MDRDDRHSARGRGRHPRHEGDHEPRHRARLRVLLAIGLAAVIALAGVGWGAWALFGPKGGPTPVLGSVPTVGKPTAKPSAALVAAVDGFGFDLLRRTSDANPSSSSVVLSPLSIHAALAMTEAGAASTTSLHMRRVLQIDGLKPQAEHQAYADLLASLAETEKGQLAIANSLWIDKDKTFLPSFLDINKQYFAAETRSVDLHTQASIDQINAWVSKATGGQIVRILDAPLPSSASIELLNATYFLGTWEKPFAAGATQLADFHVASGPAVKTQMMSVTGSFEHTKTATYEAVKLPYKGASASMLIIMPSAKSSLPRLLKTLDASRFAKVQSALVEADGSLKLPRLETRGSLQLRTVLSTMGMSDAFSTSRADFSAMTNAGPTWIDRVQHSTYLRVDEKGTEAAAATSVTMGTTAIAPNHPYEMTVDRPYIMAIMDERSGAILFLAAVRDPRG